jgi:hypothetical protein
MSGKKVHLIGNKRTRGRALLVAKASFTETSSHESSGAKLSKRSFLFIMKAALLRSKALISLLGRVGFEPTMILNQQIYSLPPLTPQPSSRDLGRAKLVA